MIDDKKIEEGARDYINKNGYFVKYDEDPCVDIEFAYKEGAKWAINEFLKDLWHPMKEEPKLVGEEIIIEMFIKDKRHSVILEYMVGEEEIPISLESVRWITDWNSFSQSRDNVIKTRWCYLKDLFPKEGGEQ